MSWSRRRSGILFQTYRLYDVLESNQSKIKSTIDNIDKDQFLISSDDDIMANLLPTFEIQPIQLHEEKKQLEQSEGKMDVAQFGARNPFGDPGPIWIESIRVKIEIPFSGDTSLWGCMPDHHDLSPPRAEIVNDRVVITLEYPHDVDHNRYKTEITRTISSINKYIDWQTMQIENYNNSLRSGIISAVESRKKVLEKHSSLADLLDIPMKVKEGAAPAKPIKVTKKFIRPLPQVPETGLKPEPGINETDFNTIVSIIRGWGRSAEATPSGFAKFDEEELRDNILAMLNGHFRGAASGEMFRRKGKTDICIQEEDRAAFVAECKFWSGPKSVADALDQLMSYLTWRDCKASLIFFNKNQKDFTSLLDKYSIALTDHKLKIDGPEILGDGEWKFTFKSHEDEARRVFIHAFFFNLS